MGERTARDFRKIRAIGCVVAGFAFLAGWKLVGSLTSRLGPDETVGWFDLSRAETQALRVEALLFATVAVAVACFLVAGHFWAKGASPVHPFFVLAAGLLVAAGTTALDFRSKEVTPPAERRMTRAVGSAVLDALIADLSDDGGGPPRRLPGADGFIGPNGPPTIDALPELAQVAASASLVDFQCGAQGEDEGTVQLGWVLDRQLVIPDAALVVTASGRALPPDYLERSKEQALVVMRTADFVTTDSSRPGEISVSGVRPSPTQTSLKGRAEFVVNFRVIIFSAPDARELVILVKFSAWSPCLQP